MDELDAADVCPFCFSPVSVWTLRELFGLEPAEEDEEEEIEVDEDEWDEEDEEEDEDEDEDDEEEDEVQFVMSVADGCFVSFSGPVAKFVEFQSFLEEAVVSAVEYRASLEVTVGDSLGSSGSGEVDNYIG